MRLLLRSPPAAATNASAATTPAAQFDSRLVVPRNGDKITWDGVVDDEATKASNVDALNQAYDAGNVGVAIMVDANARTPGGLRRAAFCRSSPLAAPR